MATKVMKFRIARHTTDLEPIIHFYRDLLGLDVLGDFNNHNGYDGVFIGIPGADWHLEFTVSAKAPSHHPDDDDLLVFYLKTSEEYTRLKDILKKNDIPEVKAKNQYWVVNGSTYTDPDGYRIVLTLDNR
jgi:catechol 2,3-dioxygenase-like lactoylglutathione lyase family enzyme